MDNSAIPQFHNSTIPQLYVYVLCPRGAAPVCFQGEFGIIRSAMNLEIEILSVEPQVRELMKAS